MHPERQFIIIIISIIARDARRVETSSNRARVEFKFEFEFRPGRVIETRGSFSFFPGTHPMCGSTRCLVDRMLSRRQILSCGECIYPYAFLGVVSGVLWICTGCVRTYMRVLRHRTSDIESGGWELCYRRIHWGKKKNPPLGYIDVWLGAICCG